MQLNPLYYVEFRDIYPLRRSAAFKITEFWPLNKVEKALSDRKEVLCYSEAQKNILKKISSILIIPHLVLVTRKKYREGLLAIPNSPDRS